MKRNISFSLYYICCFLLGTWACGEGPDLAKVARVGSVWITQEELRSFTAELPANLRNEKQGRTAREDYLQTLIDRELMFMEAHNSGLDTARGLVKELENKVGERVLLHYRMGAIYPQIEIGEEEIKKRFVREGLDRERRAWGIATKTEEELAKAIAELNSGASFEQVARVYSIDENWAKRGGELGFIGIDLARRMGIPPALFRSLPTGEVSEPQRSSRGFFLVRFSEDRTIDIDVPRNRIVSDLEKEKIRDLEEEMTEVLAQKLNWRLHREGLALLLQKGRQTTVASIDLSAAEAQTPLYLFEGGQVTLDDYVGALRRVKVRRGLEDSAAVSAMAEKLVMRQALFAEAARQEGMPTEEEVEQWRREVREKLVLTALRKVSVVDAIELSEEEIRQYYKEHAEGFHHQDTLWISEVLVETEEVAHQVRREIEAGSDIADIAGERSLRPGARENGGAMHFHAIDKYRYPQLVPAVFSAEEGQLVGPVKVRGGYSVFRFLRRAEGGPQTLAEVRSQVEAFVRRSKEREQFEVFIKNLRVKYENQIEVFDDRLHEALPDDFLAAR